MSHPPTRKTTRDNTDRLSERELSSLYRTVTGLVRSSVETLGFWVAVTTPFLYVPLLFSGLETGVEITAFLLLVVVNVVALPIGHKHSA